MSAPGPSHSTNLALPAGGLLGRIGAWQEAANRWAVRLSMLGLLAAAVVLTYSVVSRHGFGQATDWEDEFAVFALVGATFLCGPPCRPSAATSGSRRWLRCCRPR
jgi:hypothetical protein